MKACSLHRVTDGIPRILACKKGSVLKETSAGGGRARTFKTPGAYISLAQPEGAAVAYAFGIGCSSSLNAACTGPRKSGGTLSLARGGANRYP